MASSDEYVSGDASVDGYDDVYAESSVEKRINDIDYYGISAPALHEEVKGKIRKNPCSIQQYCKAQQNYRQLCHTEKITRSVILSQCWSNINAEHITFLLKQAGSEARGGNIKIPPITGEIDSNLIVVIEDGIDALWRTGYRAWHKVYKLENFKKYAAQQLNGDKLLILCKKTSVMSDMVNLPRGVILKIALYEKIDPRATMGYLIGLICDLTKKLLRKKRKRYTPKTRKVSKSKRSNS